MPEELLRLARDVKGFMPEDEGRCSTGGPSSSSRAARSSRSGATAASPRSSSVPPPARSAGRCSPSTTTVAARRTRPAGSTTTRASSTRDRPDGHAAPLPPDARRRRAGGRTWSPSSGDSATVARHWRTPLSLLFIDGGHGRRARPRGLRRLGAWVQPGGLLVDPRRVPRPGRRRAAAVRASTCGRCDGGLRARSTSLGSMRVLRRVSGEPERSRASAEAQPHSRPIAASGRAEAAAAHDARARGREREGVDGEDHRRGRVGRCCSSGQCARSGKT